ncbi:MAG: amidase [Actinomycetia bacterium]|nr:amidase [Actinomycetes bacterium]
MTSSPSLGTDLVRRLRQGELTSAALTEACLGQVERLEGELRAFVTVTPDVARARAAEADAVLADGRSLGSLHGLPVAIKDNIDTAGIRTTVGSAFFRDRVPDADAEVWRRLEAAGAVLIGKAQLHEFAYGATTQNPHHGSCRNPWDTARIPGGSSGGSGSSVAAGMAAAALGTDTGGSVRIPASLNGLSGIRPTLGRVPNTGVFYVAWSFDTVGPLARSIADCAEILAVMSGYCPTDPMSVDRPVEDFVAALSAGTAGLRVGVPRNFFFEDIDADIVALVRAAADVLADLGVSVEDVDVPGIEEANDACTRIIWAEAYAQHRERLAEQPSLFGEDLQRRLVLAHDVAGHDYARYRQLGRRWRRTLAELFERVDVLLSPTAGTDVPEVGSEMIETTVRLTHLTYGWSLAGLTALSIPCGFAQSGMPVGLQLAAAPWGEADLIRLAAAYESATSWHERQPPLATAAPAA